jgi:hypothetical protein
VAEKKDKPTPPPSYRKALLCVWLRSFFKKLDGYRFGISNSIRRLLLKDRHRFDADPDPDPTLHFDADPDSGPTFQLPYTVVGKSEVFGLFLTAMPASSEKSQVTSSVADPAPAPDLSIIKKK